MIATEPAQRRVLAHATHELRGAFGAVELCLAAAEAEGASSGGVADLAETVRAQIQRGIAAIEDVEAFLARRAVRAAREPVELGALVARRERAWTRLADLSGASLEVGWDTPGVLVLGDARRLCQALDNLVSNAIAHGGKRIALRSASDGGRLRVELHDGGPGPSREAIDGAPIRLHSRHGHGLSIARLAIESCGGRVEAIEGGVAIELPIHDLRRSEPAAPSAA